MSDTTETRWERHNEAGRRYFAQGEFGQAEEAFKAAIREATLLGPENLRLAASLSNLGQLKYRQKDLAQAEALFRRSLAIREHVLGTEHHGVLQSINNLAALYYARSDFEQAEPLFRRALSISETHLGPEHADVATALNNLARLYFRRSDYAAAAPLLSRLLELKERVLGDEHPEVAGILLSLVKVRSAAREYGEAESLCRRALAIRELLARGAPDPSVASALEALAELCLAQGKQEEHRAVLQRAKTIRARAGAGEPVTGATGEPTSGPKPRPTAETLVRPSVEMPAMPSPPSPAPSVKREAPAPLPEIIDSTIIRFEPPPRTGREAPQIEIMPAAAHLSEPPSTPRPRPEPTSAPRPRVEPPTAPAFSPLMASEPELPEVAASDARERGESAVAKAARRKTPPTQARFPRRIPTPARLAMAAAVTPGDGFESDGDAVPASGHSSEPELAEITFSRPRSRRWGVIGGVAAAIALAAVTAWAMVGRDHAEGGAVAPVESATQEPTATKSAPRTQQPVATPTSQALPASDEDSSDLDGGQRVESASAQARTVDEGRGTARRPALSSSAPSPARTSVPDEDRVELPTDLNRIGIDRALRGVETSAKARVDSVSRTIPVKPPTFGRP